MTDESAHANESGPITGALLSSDIVDSTKLIAGLGDQRSSEVFARHDELARDLIQRFHGQELNRTDGFLILFARTIDAVGYALDYVQSLRRLAAQTSVPLLARVGIHFGELYLRQVEAASQSSGARPVQPEGLAVPMTARIMSLGSAGQILLTRTAFDLARRAVVGSDLFGEGLSWLSHGLYRFKGVDEPLEVYEVGIKGQSPLTAPPSSDKAIRAVGPGEEDTLGWRPAAGQVVPHRANWTLEEKVGEGGFGEVWLARNSRTKLARVFKFCFQADRLRGLKREVTLFTLLREALGDRTDIAHILDYQFEDAPFFIEAEYTKEGSLVTWSERRGGLETVELAARLEIVAQVAEALGAAHSAGILHKDVKPSNILVLSDVTMPPKVALADFGIGIVVDRSLLAAAGVTDGAMPASTLTYNESSRTGTRIYMAPELLEGRLPSTRSDIFSLGVLLYQMVTAQFGRALASDWREEISDPLLRADIADCVAGRPADRLTSAFELAARLRSLPGRRRERARGRLVRFAAALSVVALLILAGGVAAYRHEAQLRRSAETARDDADVARAEAEAAAAAEATVRRAAEVSELNEKRARGTAEGVMKFMLFKMRDKLRPLKRLDLLEEVAVASLAYFDEIPPEEGETTSSLRDRTRALDNIAEVLHFQGKIREADEVYRKVHAIRSDLMAREPQNVTLLSDLGVSQLKLAEMQQSLGNLEVALAGFAEAADTFVRVLDRNPKYSNALQREAICRERMALILEDLGRPVESIRGYEAAIPTFEAIHGSSSASPQAIDNLTRILRTLGEGKRRRGRFVEALDHLTRAVELLASPPLELADDGTLQAGLALTLRNRGALLANLGRIAEAKSDLVRANEIGQALVDGDPKNERNAFDLIDGRIGEARVAWYDGRPDEALGLLAEQAAAIAQKEAAGLGTVADTLGGLAYAQAMKARILVVSPERAEEAKAAADALAETANRYLATSPESEGGKKLAEFAMLIRGWAAKGIDGDAEGAGDLQKALEAYRVRYEKDAEAIDTAEIYATALLVMGRRDEATPVVEKLLATGYRNPEFLRVCRQFGLEIEPLLAVASSTP